MTLPSGSQQTFSVLLEFTTNEALFNEIEKKTEHIVDGTERAKEMTRLYSEEIKRLHPELYKEIEAEKQRAAALEKTKEAAKKTSAQIREMRAEARLITNEVRLLKDQAEDLDRIARPLFAGGALVVGGIFALANEYVENATEATQVTREWKAAQADLEQSGKEIGAVLAKEALPLLKEAAQVSKQVADIIQRNPEVVKATLYGGMLALAVGTIGKLYISGLKLYADIKLDRAMTLQFAAAELQLKASQNQLQAAGIQSSSSSVPQTSTRLGNAALLGGAAGIGAIGTFNLAQQGIGFGVASGERFQQALINMGILSEETGEKLDKARDDMYDFAKGLPLIGSLFAKVGDDVQDTVDELRQTATGNFLGGSRETQDAAVEVFANWRQDDARIMQEAMDARLQIVADGEREIANITQNYMHETSQIAQQFNNEAAQITSNFLEQSRQAEEDYLNARVDLLRESEERIQEIRNEAQEKREEAERDFAKAAARAGADRDALALVQAQEARDEALEEADRGVNEAIQRERQETQQRLAELAQRYAQERAQRQAEYEQDLKENAARRAAALKEAAERHQAELKQQREAQAQKLKDLQDATQQERVRRREMAIAQLQDLGLVLNNERQLRSTAYSAMLMDLQAWLQTINASFGGATSATSASSLGSASGGSVVSLNPNSGFSGSGMYGTVHDYSGYAYTGVYRMAQDGKPEWVMSGNDTKAAENAIGGKLTQSSMAQMIALAAAARSSRNVVDNSVYGKDMTIRQIRDIKEETARRLEKMLGGY